MTLVYLILPVTFMIAGAFVAAFIWATRSGQFDDLTTPAARASFPDSGGTPSRETRSGNTPIQPIHRKC